MSARPLELTGNRTNGLQTTVEQHMTMRRGSRIVPAIALALISIAPVVANAQTCRGMPRGGGISAVLGNVYLGQTYGVAASKGPIALGFNSLSSDTDVSAWDANIRFTVAMGASKLQVCPSLVIDYQNQTIPVSDGSELTARHATVGAGVGLSYQLDLTQGISVSPFLAGDFHFNGIMYSLSNEDQDEDELSGDTLSFVNLQYGGVVQWKTFYAAFVADRSLAEDGGVYRTRLMLGLSLGGGSSSRRSMKAAPKR